VSEEIEPLQPGAGAWLAERWRQAWLEATPEAFGECCSVEVFYEDPLAIEPREGLGDLAAHAGQLRVALPDMRIEAVGEAVIDGRNGCIPWRLVGTHRGDVGDIPHTGRFLTLAGVHYVALVDGRVRRARGVLDLEDAAVQLGMLPKRGSLGESAIMLLRGFGLRRA
jgi:predicted ester cyclase